MHLKAEHCRRIDVRRWQREGMLRNGRAGSWAWTDTETGERLASIGYRSDGYGVALNYSVDGRDCSQRVQLASTACHYSAASGHGLFARSVASAWRCSTCGPAGSRVGTANG